MDEVKVIRLVKGSPEWAFIAAQQALAALNAVGIRFAQVTLFVDGSGELRIPKEEFGKLTPEVRSTLPDLVGSVRLDPMEQRDLVIRQCQGFAYRDLR